MNGNPWKHWPTRVERARGEMQSHEFTNVLQLHGEHGLEATARRLTAMPLLMAKDKLNFGWVGIPFAIAQTLNPPAIRRGGRLK